MSKFRLEFDGVSRGNPGHSGAASSLRKIDPGGYDECVWFDSDYLGTKTSNQAEYHALLLGLEECVQRQVPNLEICGDSELVIRQLSGEYQVKHKKLKPLHKKAKDFISLLSCTPTYKWIPREENTHCDQIANLIVDRHLGLTEEDEDEENDFNEDEIEERGENFGFTRDELNILLSYGMKPWKGDYGECWDFINAYKSGEVDEDGEPTWARHLASSSMWDD
jgi:ribonuclease HI